VAFSNAPGVSVVPGPVRFRWRGGTGLEGGGPVAKDGRYTMRVTVVDATGGRAETQARILLDTRAPLMRWGTGGITPQVLAQGPLTLRFRLYDLAERVRIKVALRDQVGRALRTGRGESVPPGRISLRWPRTHGARLLPSGYQVSLRGLDEAGNAATSAPKTFLVNHAVRSRVYALYRRVGRRIALTFDDCNSSSAWASILSTLRRYRIKATFFCPGQQVLANPSLARRTVRDGHAVGSHGWDHANFDLLSFASAKRRLDDDRAVWWKLARVAPTPYFRPPYGAYDSTTMAAAGRAGYGAVVLWDVDPRDWTQPGSGAIESRILGAVRPGSIVLMHVLGQTAAMLPSLIRTLRARHYIPLTLPELDRVGVANSGGWPAYRSSTTGA
jgi:peptidoglycan/xylan/chitin deacetylase (PgdA/CDA1 family)